MWAIILGALALVLSGVGQIFSALDGKPLHEAITMLGLTAVFILLIMVPYRIFVTPTVDPILRDGIIALRKSLGRGSHKT